MCNEMRVEAALDKPCVVDMRWEKRRGDGAVEECQGLLGEAVLYLFPAAVESMKANLALQESTFNRFKVEVVDVFRGIYGPEFARMQPSCTVPLLKLADGKLLRNADEIVRFAQEFHPPYTSDDDEEDPSPGVIKAFCDRISSWDEMHFSFGNPYASSRRGLIETSAVRRMRLDTLRKNFRRYAVDDRNLANIYLPHINQLTRKDMSWEERVHLAQRSSLQLDEILDSAEELLKSNQFLFGRDWTTADSMLVPVLHRVKELGHVNRFKRRPNLSRYFLMISGRPSFQRAVAPFNHEWMRKNYYSQLLASLILRAIPYVLILLVLLLILVTAYYDNLYHLSLGGHEPVIPNQAPEVLEPNTSAHVYGETAA
eukprot:Plantae.Rhodophyta-Purpureofilum_apyrenoidigerum.ctg8082.p1 GENE.Plantae.Rhodophyta-Purpureofilum_apyrenoidigerum.ctg8082~~Plantae.Rhodophyta-Purpureofilum_apyrenoidigerum.ctg8082.p1  ORF type:complete len:370 (-),score=51.64 Plantae.Rhodophyta-Purpureofilum_apyrenoidigerum.ctg8082:152-1261(-)